MNQLWLHSWVFQNILDERILVIMKRVVIISIVGVDDQFHTSISNKLKYLIKIFTLINHSNKQGNKFKTVNDSTCPYPITIQWQKKFVNQNIFKI